MGAAFKSKWTRSEFHQNYVQWIMKLKYNKKCTSKHCFRQQQILQKL